MENFINDVSALWGTFLQGGITTAREITYAVTGIEITNAVGLALFVASVFAVVGIVLIAMRRQKKTTFLMQDGRRYTKR